MEPVRANPLVHLELHTGDLPGASAFYVEICRWRPAQIRGPHGPYLAMEWGGAIGGGIVESPVERPLWLPYVEVPEIVEATDRARRLGATVLLDPREGPAGWRSVVSAPTGGQLAFWQPKR